MKWANNTDVEGKCRLCGRSAEVGGRVDTVVNCGDINQGCGNALSIVEVGGSPEGLGLPDHFVVEDTRTGRRVTYTPYDS